MAQGFLSFQYEKERQSSGMTALAGLALYTDLAHAIGLPDSIRRYIRARENSQGWSDAQMVMSGILLNEAGGECVADLNVLEADRGFARLLRHVETAGMTRKERRIIQRRWRKKQKRSVPSPSSMFRYLKKFHDPHQETLRKMSDIKAFIPAPNEYLKGFAKVSGDIAAWAQKQQAEKLATLDLDATLIETTKNEAKYCYKKFKSYQPLNVWWAEQHLMLHTEFRDGNVPAGYEILRVLIDSLELLPKSVEKVQVRSDTAAYQHDFLRYMAAPKGPNKRFGVIEFAVGCDVTKEFKKAAAEVKEEDWKPIRHDEDGYSKTSRQEYAEVCFVPNKKGFSKKDAPYRYIATREPMAEQILPGMEEQQKLPFQTIRLQNQRYKLFGIVTNIANPDDPLTRGEGRDGEKVIKFLRKRCGKSEEAHALLKTDLAGGTLPSGDFGKNAAWWWMATTAMNLNSLVKRHLLQGDWRNKRMKAMRHSLINIAGRVIEHGRRMIIRISGSHPAFRLLLDARKRILELTLPSG